MPLSITKTLDPSTHELFNDVKAEINVINVSPVTARTNTYVRPAFHDSATEQDTSIFVQSFLQNFSAVVVVAFLCKAKGHYAKLRVSSNFHSRILNKVSVNVFGQKHLFLKQMLQKVASHNAPGNPNRKGATRRIRF